MLQAELSYESRSEEYIIIVPPTPTKLDCKSYFLIIPIFSFLLPSPTFLRSLRNSGHDFSVRTRFGINKIHDNAGVDQPHPQKEETGICYEGCDRL